MRCGVCLSQTHQVQVSLVPAAFVWERGEHQQGSKSQEWAHQIEKQLGWAPAPAGESHSTSRQWAWFDLAVNMDLANRDLERWELEQNLPVPYILPPAMTPGSSYGINVDHFTGAIEASKGFSLSGCKGKSLPLLMKAAFSTVKEDGFPTHTTKVG